VTTSAPRIGLVLGAGGVTGGAFHAGVLAALFDLLGWDARRADLVVGTSAGSLTGSLLRAGVAPRDLLAGSRDEPLSPAGAALLAPLQARRDAWPPPSERRRPRLAEPGVLVHAARRPWRARPGAVAAALIPAGAMSTAVISDGIDPLFAAWPEQPLWINAVRMRDGRRIVFGRGHAARPSVGSAVAASCAIPGYFTPVTIDGDRYVDGGAHSPTNLDLVRRERFDLVVVSSPMSVAGRTPSLRYDALARRYFRATLDVEAVAVRRTGTRVVAFQPTPADRTVMGLNPMDPQRRAATAEQAYQSTVRRLERHDVLRRLEVLTHTSTPATPAAPTR
jgi:NTE family protein